MTIMMLAASIKLYWHKSVGFHKADLPPNLHSTPRAKVKS
jgi:hypothetical protein